MATCGTAACPKLPSTDREVRILRWTFRRADEAVICELGLNADYSAYELTLNPARNPAETTTQLFDDAMSAFERQAAIERILADEGWMLEGFESERVTRPI